MHVASSASDGTLAAQQWDYRPEFRKGSVKIGHWSSHMNDQHEIELLRIRKKRLAVYEAQRRLRDFATELSGMVAQVEDPVTGAVLCEVQSLDDGLILKCCTGQNLTVRVHKTGEREFESQSLSKADWNKFNPQRFSGLGMSRGKPALTFNYGGGYHTHLTARELYETFLAAAAQDENKNFKNMTPLSPDVV